MESHLTLAVTVSYNVIGWLTLSGRSNQSRTDMVLLPKDFKSFASAYFAILRYKSVELSNYACSLIAYNNTTKYNCFHHALILVLTFYRDSPSLDLTICNYNFI